MLSVLRARPIEEGVRPRSPASSRIAPPLPLTVRHVKNVSMSAVAATVLMQGHVATNISASSLSSPSAPIGETKPKVEETCTSDVAIDHSLSVARSVLWPTRSTAPRSKRHTWRAGRPCRSFPVTSVDLCLPSFSECVLQYHTRGERFLNRFNSDRLCSELPTVCV